MDPRYSTHHLENLPNNADLLTHQLDALLYYSRILPPFFLGFQHDDQQDFQTQNHSTHSLQMYQNPPPFSFQLNFHYPRKIVNLSLGSVPVLSVVLHLGLPLVHYLVPLGFQHGDQQDFQTQIYSTHCPQMYQNPPPFPF